MNENILELNLKSLSNINADLTEWIKLQKEVSWAEIIKTRNKSSNLLIRQGSKRLPAYNSNSPQKEARQLIKATRFFKEDATIIIGMGLGYLANAIVNKMEKGHRLIVVDPVAHILRMGLSNFDFSKYISNHGFLIATKGKGEVATTIGIIDSQCVINHWNVFIERYTLLRPDEYQRINELTLQVINQLRSNTGTVVNSGSIIADNDIANLPYVIRHRGVKELEGLFKGKPAVLVSTGPSLEKNIHRLIPIQDNVIIIAVGQALRPLLAYDIRPDFICTVDFGEVNMTHFIGLMDSDVPLVALNRTYAPLLKAWKGPKFIVATPTPGFDHTAAGILKDKGSIDQGGSVAHLCLGFAVSLGCNPIAFIGQDLALTDKSHIAQVDSGGKIRVDKNGIINWKVEDPESNLDNKTTYGMGPVHYVPGYYGNVVPTNLGLLSFITSFEAMIRALKKREDIDITIINATQGGAKIKGTEQKSLQQVIDKYCKKTINKKDKLRPLLSLAKDEKDLVTAAIPMLKEDIENLDVISKQSKLGLAIATGLVKKKVISKQKRNHYLKALLAKNEIFSIAAHQAALKNPLINVAIYGASRAIWSRELKVKGKVSHLLKNSEDLKTRVKRNKLILTAAKKAAESLRKSYKTALGLLEVYIETGHEDMLVDKEIYNPDLSTAEEYFQAGNFAHPLLDAQIILAKNPEHEEAKKILNKALTLRSDIITEIEEKERKNSDKPTKLVEYNELVEQARKLGHDKKDFDKAIILLSKANKLMPDKIEARWGLATSFHHVGKFRESIKKYKSLMKSFPDRPIFRFEMGQVLLRTGELIIGLKEIGKAMEETSEFDNFLARIGDIYCEADMPNEAIIAYEEYLKKFPTDFRIWTTKGDCLLNKMNNPNMARICFRKALSIKPDYQNAQNLLDSLPPQKKRKRRKKK